MVCLSECRVGPSLVVLPGLNGELLYARNLVERIGSQVRVVGLQPYLELKHSDMYRDFKRLAAEYVQVILRSGERGPFRFLGYSYGAILGFEVARQIQDLNHEVAFVGSIDAGPDPGFDRWNPGSLLKQMVRVAVNLPRWVASSCGPKARKHTLIQMRREIRYRLRWLASLGRSRYGFEDAFGSSHGDDSRTKVLGQVFQGLNDYVPNNFKGKVTLFRAKTRPLFHSLSPDLGWSQFADAVAVHRVPGDHSSILDPPAIDVISDVIMKEMNRSDSTL